jgi:hypothetical protein
VTTSIWFWLAFNAGVLIALTIDLAQFKHRGRELSMRAATQRTAIWIVLSLLFNLLVWKLRGPDKALEFLTGYVIEYSLSVDNIFVFVIIFAYFKVPPMAQHRALVWGIVGALVMRGVMILLGVTLLLLSGCSGDGGETGGAPGAACQSNCPTAKAGPEQAVLAGDAVTLDGSGSTSGTPGLITYQWTLQSKPAGSAARHGDSEEVGISIVFVLGCGSSRLKGHCHG